jgi:membrane protease YdiL (CAAX protease family)
MNREPALALSNLSTLLPFKPLMVQLATMLFRNTNTKQKVAILIPPILIAVMYPVFLLLVGSLNDRIAWYLGLASYWVIWGVVFPLVIIGKNDIKKLIRPRKLNRKVLFLIAIPLLGASAARLVPGMEYSKEGVWISVLILSTAFGNGFFEEVLWRGVYVNLFPNNILYRMIWPSICFGLWHFVPGSVFHDNVISLLCLMFGAGLMGLYLSYLAKKMNTVWWPIVVHTIGGIIMVA